VTYETIECSNQVEGNLGPAFNGHTDGFIPVTCDLSAFSGSIVIAIRVVTDGSVHEGGFWVDDVALDGAVLSDGSSLEGWSSPTEFNPIDVEAYTVRLVAFRGSSRVFLGTIPLNDDFNGVLSGGLLRKAVGTKADTVAAIVTYHDSTETVLQYAPYTLRVNGVVQPGG
jgi:hypothetical protein